MKGLVVLSLHAVLVFSYGHPTTENDASNYLSNISVLGHSFKEPEIENSWGDGVCEKAIDSYVRPHQLVPLCNVLLETGQLAVDRVFRSQDADAAHQVTTSCDKNQAGRVCRMLEKRGSFTARSASFCSYRLKQELMTHPGRTWDLCRRHVIYNQHIVVNTTHRNDRLEMLFDGCFHSQHELARACESVEPPRGLGFQQCSSIQHYWHVVLILGSEMNIVCKKERPELEVPLRAGKALERKTQYHTAQAVRESCRCHNEHSNGRDPYGAPWGDSNIRRSNERPPWTDSNMARRDWNPARGPGSYDQPPWGPRHQPGAHDQNSWTGSDRGLQPWNNPSRPGLHDVHHPRTGLGMRPPPFGPGMRPAPYPVAPYVPQGPVLTETDMEKLMRLSQQFGFEIRNGLFAIFVMPQEARNAGVSWRLVYDLDADAKSQSRMRFEMCDAREQGRVVTKIGGQYIYGFPLEVNGQAWSSATISATGQNELLCDNGNLTYVKVRGKSISDFRPVEEAIAARKRGQFIKCDDVNKCQQTKCESSACNFNLVASVTADAKAGDGESASATATARASFKFDFEPCQTPTVCNCVRTCAEESNCMVQKPIRGVAPAPVPREQVRGATIADVAHAIAAAKAGHSDGGVHAAAEAEAGFDGRGNRGLRGSMGAGRRPGFHDSMLPDHGRAGVMSGHIEAQSEVTVGGRPSGLSNLDDSPFSQSGHPNSTGDRFGAPGIRTGQPGWRPSGDRGVADGNVVFAGCGRVAIASNILIGAVGLALLF
ncbi:hypothetical protein XA68_16578 [Ophiocordyceps unilateralis]|uniref:Uncharacterized protein n=1 Tax=Ophiocordyceps unilateralis TaxID=268505 RepID=A0A2A9PJM3_OPHUN|nr:hypothetical protein XA68_16578 [Ophiocordyceps unilateralis]